MTYYQTITPGDDDGPAAHPHDASEISGEASFITLRVNKLLAGTITGKEIIVAGGADGILRSDGFVAGSSGWRVLGDGTAELNDVTVRGDFITGVSSGARVEIGSTGGTYPAEQIRFFTGNASEITEGQITGIDTGSGSAAQGSLLIEPPITNSVSAYSWLSVASGTTTNPEYAKVSLNSQDGTGAATDHAHIDITPYEIAMGVRTFYDTLYQFKVIPNMVVLPVKTTTGDPTNVEEGAMYVNTFDNALRLYADAAWRSVVTW